MVEPVKSAWEAYVKARRKTEACRKMLREPIAKREYEKRGPKLNEAEQAVARKNEELSNAKALVRRLKDELNVLRRAANKYRRADMTALRRQYRDAYDTSVILEQCQVDEDKAYAEYSRIVDEESKKEVN